MDDPDFPEWWSLALRLQQLTLESFPNLFKAGLVTEVDLGSSMSKWRLTTEGLKMITVLEVMNS